MPDLETILAEWDKDKEIDPTELGEAARNIPRLHAKYLRWLSLEKMALKTLESDLRKLRFVKQQYYMEGPANLQEYEGIKKIWKTVPDRQRTILKAAVDEHLDADLDIDDLRLRRDLSQTKVEALDLIMKAIMSRSYVINNMIQWDMWKGGGK